MNDTARREMSPHTTPATGPHSAFTGFALAGLLGCVVAIYFVNLGTLNIRGEESRRASVALEMLSSGNWLVPQLQGNALYPSCRPPLQPWLIASLGWWRGEVDEVAVRLPSAAAVLLTVLLVFAYCRSFLPATGALLAATAFATLAQVVELGTLGETDALFTLWVSGSLLVWHTGLRRGWPAAAMWMSAYFFVALGTMTKGTQAPVYFVASIGLYLLYTRQWKVAFSVGHLCGMLTFLLVWGSWQLPYYLEMGPAAVRHMYYADVSIYGLDRSLGKVLYHIFLFPLEIAAGCLLPWSVFLLLYARRDFRAKLGSAADPATFLTCCLLATFPSVWFIIGAKTRFYMPLYPVLAILMGIALQRTFEATSPAFGRALWKHFSGALAIVMVVAGIGLAGVTLTTPLLAKYGQTALPSVLFAVVSLALAAVVWSTRQPQRETAGPVGVLAIAAFMALVVVGPLMQFKQHIDIPRGSQMAELKARLPADAKLYSLGDVDHCFAFEYQQPILRCEWPQVGTELPANVEYFCYRVDDANAVQTPGFAWEPVGVVSVARFRGQREAQYVVAVARRLQTGQARPFQEAMQEYVAGRAPATLR